MMRRRSNEALCDRSYTAFVAMVLCSLFQLLLMEMVPGTSIVTPLIGKYLLFTCILVSISIIISVFVLNLTQRSLSTHVMPPFVRRVFINLLPRLLCMQRPVEAQREDVDFSQAHSELLPFDNPYKKVSVEYFSAVSYTHLTLPTIYSV